MAVEKRLVLLKNANKCVRQGKNEAAIKQFNRILEIKPDDLEVRRIVGDLYLKQHDVNAAVEHFEWIADYYLKEGFFSKAIAMYKRITRVSPNYEDVYFKLADLYTKQGLVIEAKQIYLDLAEENKRKSNPKRALDMYKKILEFDRNNLKMRMLLADNYLREGLEENAVTEYLIAADRLLAKKDFSKAEELLDKILQKTKNEKIVEKLVNCYSLQGKDRKAIDTLTGMGAALFKNSSLLKMLGELYFRNNQLDEAEKIFIKITQINPEEKEVILKLGKVYLHRKEFDKTYSLFLPIIDQAIANSRLEEATSLLRFIIASNSSHLPALLKLAEIFEMGGKKNNLIALYESLIPIYEEKGMKKELEEVLEKLISLADSSFTYQEHLARIRGKHPKEKESPQFGEEEKQRTEFIRFNMKVVDEAVRDRDFDKAVAILQKSRETFPQNIEIRLKAFDVYQMLNRIDLVVEEGVALLEMYKASNNVPEFNRMLDTLTLIKPNDPRLVEYTLNEKTNIEIDFGKEELEEQFSEIDPNRFKEIDFEESAEIEDDVFLLSDDHTMQPGEPAEEPAEEPEFDHTSSSEMHLNSFLGELDEMLKNGNLAEAGQMLDYLEKMFPGTPEVRERHIRYEKLQVQTDFEKGPFPEDSDARMDTEDMGMPEFVEPVEEIPEVDLGGFEIESNSISPEEEALLPESEASEHEDDTGIFSGSDLDIDLSVASESESAQMAEDSRDIPAEEARIDLPQESAGPGFAEIENFSFEIDIEEADSDEILPLQEIDQNEIVQSPSSSGKAASEMPMDSSANFLLDIDDIMVKTEPEPEPEAESPFQDLDVLDESPFDTDGDLLEEDNLLLEVEDYFETEKIVSGELEFLADWMKELERQNTSTSEKNMIEIFEEFKKGVEEKIGEEDFDTRYNLGIAYKEMGLLEEAIHEFLISSKHPEKFFDSAGLLGLCFREKGMFSEAVSWLEKALNVPGRKDEEYLAIRYELALSFKMSENFQGALQVLKEILLTNPDYRDVSDMQQELVARLQK